MTTPEDQVLSARVNRAALAVIYALYFATGATSLIFEILWMRQFVIVFGNSSYAISVVLAAFMGGLGIGAWAFGKIVDRRGDPLKLFAMIEGGIIAWALLMPAFLAGLGRAAAAVVPSTSSLATESMVRFVLSFAVLLVPCVLMGGTLPVLTRFVAGSREMIGTRLSILYGLNTLGAAVGCFFTGFYLIETLGQSGTNTVAVSTNLAVLAVVLALRAARGGRSVGEPATASGGEAAGAGTEEGVSESVRALLLTAVFVSGFATMAVEVLWVRYLVFVVPNSQYSFTGILGVFLVGMAVGSLLYNVILKRSRKQLQWLGGIEVALGPVTLAALMLGTYSAMGSGPEGFLSGAPSAGGFLGSKGGALGLALVTVFAPAVLIGAVFPLIASTYTKSVAAVGRSVGRVSAVNTLGCIIGSLAPVLFLVAWLGIQNGIFAIAVLNTTLGVVIVAAVGKRKGLFAAAAAAIAFAAAWLVMPANLTQELFFASPKHKGRHHEVLFYREGPTATVMVLKDVVSGFKEVYIGGVEEVPTVYSGHVFFKLFGSLGPLLHPRPTEALVLCLGGGIAAGTMVPHPEVERVECVDLVEDMVGACRQLGDVNNGLVDSAKFSAVIEDARNYLVKNRKKFPVIICDSTHPKSPDSWPLYTTEFYESVKGALAEDGVFLQWAPVHGMSIREYEIILKTFQSVFPHTSVWYVAGLDEIGTNWATTMMLATPERLSIDPDLLERRLAAEAVKRDLEYWNLDTAQGILSNFLCGEETVREWTAGAPVNTDDLPYTQYLTRFTGATEYGWSEIARKVESVWPYVKAGGNSQDYSGLQASLELSIAARKVLLERKNIAAALKASPTDGTLLRMKDNLRRAEQYLGSLAEIYHDDDRMLVEIAQRVQSVCQYGGREPDESFDRIASVYKQALAVNARNVAALTGIGALSGVTGRHAEAQEYLNKALELDPDNVQAHFNLGTFLYEMEQYAQAIEHLERAAQLAPHRFDIHNSLAMALMAVGSADSAIVQIDKAIALSGRSIPDLYYNLGHAYAVKGDLANALESFRLAVSGNPASAQFHLWLGITLLDNGDAKGARVELDKALSIDETSVLARTKLGVILLGEGRVDEAMAQWRKVLETSPGDPETREQLARALVAKREFATAIGILRDGMNLQPTTEIAEALAWLLATCPAAEVRNGQEAVRIAQDLDRITGYSSVEAMDVLGAAYAEAGFFADAVKAAHQGLNRAVLQGKSEQAAQIQKRLDLYKAGRPYHEE